MKQNNIDVQDLVLESMSEDSGKEDEFEINNKSLPSSQNNFNKRDRIVLVPVKPDQTTKETNEHTK